MKKQRVLILCTGNSCRSQMAEGFLRRAAGDRFEVFSAGVNPTAVNPFAIKVMAEAGVDISAHTSKSAAGFAGQPFDYVMTVCDNARQTCPVFPGRYEAIHWDIEDPAGADGSEEERLAFFRKVRDEIHARVRAFAGSG